MSRIANRGMFSQETTQRHDDIVILVSLKIRTLTEYLIRGRYPLSEPHCVGGRTPTIDTKTVDPEGHKYILEYPVYNGNFLVGFADLIALYRVNVTRERQPDFNPAEDSDTPYEEWGAYLVEVKTGSLKTGETMRQIKAYSDFLKHRLIEVPGTSHKAAIESYPILIVDEPAAGYVIDAFANEGILVTWLQLLVWNFRTPGAL